jgi:phosphate transport system protein
MTRTHLDRAFDAQLHEVREALLAMMEHVESMVWGSMQAVVGGDLRLAARVVESDSVVDRAERDIDEACLCIITRFQPMASDLRLVTLAMKMVTDLERMGDVAVNICERVLDLDEAPLLVENEDLLQMAGTVRGMIREAREAFAQGDVEQATSVIWCDEDVDRMYLRVFREVVLRMQEQPENVERGVALLGAAKALERVADHAVNLAENVIHLVNGEDVRHQSYPPLRPLGVA